MEKYIKEKITPRGLRFDKEPTFDKHVEPFMERWNNLLEDFSFRLMGLIVERRKEYLKELNVEINVLQQQLEECLNKEEVTAFSETLTKSLEMVEKETVAIKVRKYRRDVQDYATGNVRRKKIPGTERGAPLNKGGKTPVRRGPWHRSPGPISRGYGYAQGRCKDF